MVNLEYLILLLFLRINTTRNRVTNRKDISPSHLTTIALIHNHNVFQLFPLTNKNEFRYRNIGDRSPIRIMLWMIRPSD